MSANEIVGVRCAVCEAVYTHEHDLLSDQLVWVRPKPLRENRRVVCKHIGTTEVRASGGEWQIVEVKR